MIEDENHLRAVFKHDKDFLFDVQGDDAEYELATIDCLSRRMKDYFDRFLTQKIYKMEKARYVLNCSVKLTFHEMSEEEFKELFNGKDKEAK